MIDMKSKPTYQELENRIKELEELNNSHQIAKLGRWELNLKTQIITLSPEHQILIGGKPQRISIYLFDYAEKHIVPEDIPVIQDRLIFKESKKKVEQA